MTPTPLDERLPTVEQIADGIAATLVNPDRREYRVAVTGDHGGGGVTVYYETLHPEFHAVLNPQWVEVEHPVAFGLPWPDFHNFGNLLRDAIERRA